MEKPRLVVIGSGWAGYYIAEKINLSKYSVTVISPRRTCAFTPLLASAAVGLFNFYLAEEPVRSRSRPGLIYYKATVDDIDFEKKLCQCTPAFDDDMKLQKSVFEVPYDYLVVAPGSASNTFGTPGVAEHALFMRNVTDAMSFRKSLFDVFEKASLPNQTEKQIRALLHFAIVGGGPTGVEMTAEMDDLLSKELKYLYPNIIEYAKISIYDVAPEILGGYDAKLHEYATQQLEKRGIDVAPNTTIEKVTESSIHIKGEGQVPYGILVWATGNKEVPLLQALDGRVRFPEKGPTRILTDDRCRILRSEDDDDEKDSDSFIPDAFAIGDAADIDGQSLPTTAEVACQKAKFLVNNLNLAAQRNLPFEQVIAARKPFKFASKALVSYIGGHDGLIASGDGGKADDGAGWTGHSAWLSWRGSTLKWNRSWHARIMIVLTWILNYLFGVGIARM